MPEKRRWYQEVSLSILLEFQRVCEELGLRYYLTAGTLLGAVRHKGFIPWDDDIDVAMPKEDYEAFFSRGRQLLSPEYFFQECRTETNFPYYFAKVRKKGTQAVEPLLGSIQMEQGLYIDIFPLDVCPDSEGGARRFFKGIELLGCAVLSRVSPEFVCGYTKPYMRLGWNVLRRLPNRTLFWLRKRLCSAVARRASGERLCTVGGAHGYPRESYEAAWFRETVFMEFEGHSFPAPGGWNALLRNMYGDYMVPPPEDKRGGHFKKEGER